MSLRQKKMAARIGVSLVLFVCVYAAGARADMIWYVRLALFLAVYLLIGWDIVWKAVRNLMHGQLFDENFLMTLATAGAFAIGEYPEAVAVMLFYQVGEFFQSYAVGRSRKSIAALMDIRPDCANVEKDGRLHTVDPEEVAPGEIIVIRPGERIPLDGAVTEGDSTVDTSALTGESLPVTVGPGSDLISGCVNGSGLLRVRVTKPYGESTVSRILELVEHSSEKKARAEHFITRFSRVYTPAVVAGALLLALVPPLLSLGSWTDWMGRALTFLVISCPCALVISVPLSFFGGIGGASRQGILVKGGNYLEALARTRTAVFDKTGTLTCGTFRVTEVHPVGTSERQLLTLAASAERYSHHPIARSLQDACPDADAADTVEELPGRGVRAVIGTETVYVGNGALMDMVGAAWEECSLPGSVVHIAVDGAYRGYIVISDRIREDAADAVRQLDALGVERIVMLTGDRKETGEEVARQLGIREVYTELLPADKVEKTEGFLAETAGRGTLAFVGDGVNDAPVLSRADVGIAMGGLGSDAAIEAADIVIMEDRPSKVPQAIRIARKTLRIVRQNIWFALGVKALVLLLGALGMADLWWAVFADVGVSMIAVLNASRALRVR